MCSPQSPIMKEINVLLLGETGIGKSTFINALVNYLTYEKLNDALNGDLLSVIPASFVERDSETCQRRTVSIGDDTNEARITGASSTQACRSYTFQLNKNTILRIIDTPGVGDTRGISEDAKNFHNIMSHLSNYDHLNGICLLLKPNQSRQTVFFQFCIKELLAHLHRSAVDNIIFCFTNARSTSYQPGDTEELLTHFLSELRAQTGVEVPFNERNVFGFDNESFRFVVAHKQGVRFNNEAKSNYEQSWEKSVEHSAKLISYISQCTPHYIRDMLSLNQVRRLINEIIRPLAEISQNILINISLAQERIAELRNTESSITDLLSRLTIPAVDLESTQLQYPRTVCTANQCTRRLTCDKQVKIDYNTHCHPRCYLQGVAQNVVNNSALQRCQAMDGQGKCKQCGCFWNAHMHISYETRQVHKESIDRSVEEQIKTKEGRAKAIRRSEETLEQKVRDLHQEQITLTKACIELSKFLHQNSITPYNDDFIKYIEHLIHEEQQKCSAGGHNQSIIDGLYTMIQTCQHEIDIHKKMMYCSPEQRMAQAPQFKEIQKLIDDLYNLPYSGPILRQQVRTIQQSYGAVAHRYETACTMPVNDIFIGRIKSFNGNIFD